MPSAATIWPGMLSNLSLLKWTPRNLPQNLPAREALAARAESRLVEELRFLAPHGMCRGSTLSNMYDSLVHSTVCAVFNCIGEIIYMQQVFFLSYFLRIAY